MAFVILKLKQNVGEPYAIYDLEKFGVWPFKKKRLVIGAESDRNDIILMTSRVKKRKFGEIVKTEEGWKYKILSGNKIKEGIFIHGIKIPIFDNVIEFKEEL